MKDFSNAHRTELLDALDGLQPLVADSRGDFDRNRRLPDTLMRALARAGMFRLLLPAGLGGLGLSPLDFMDVVERAASLDGSVGWLVGNGGGMSRAAGMLAEGAAKAIFSDTDCFVAASTGAVGKAVPTGEGFAVSGRWLFGSGSSHATWFAVLCEVDEGQPAGQGRMIFAFVPRSAVTVIDTWHASGLRATASCDFTIADASVPAAFCHDFQPTPTQPGITNRLPTRSIFSWTVATVPLGIATAALSAFRALAAGHRRQGGAVPLAERGRSSSKSDASRRGWGRARVSAFDDGRSLSARRGRRSDERGRSAGVATGRGPRGRDGKPVSREALRHRRGGGGLRGIAARTLRTRRPRRGQACGHEPRDLCHRRPGPAGARYQRRSILGRRRPISPDPP
ncbi:MAG: acyl-CoA dehydrogenase family protein [Paracoccaceae bacterium]